MLIFHLTGNTDVSKFEFTNAGYARCLILDSEKDQGD